MNQGPRGDCLMEKNEGRKSHDTVPLNSREKCSFDVGKTLQKRLVNGTALQYNESDSLVLYKPYN
jgi:hypothetical protein